MFNTLQKLLVKYKQRHAHIRTQTYKTDTGTECNWH